MPMRARRSAASSCDVTSALVVLSRSQATPRNHRVMTTKPPVTAVPLAVCRECNVASTVLSTVLLVDCSRRVPQLC